MRDKEDPIYVWRMVIQPETKINLLNKSRKIIDMHCKNLEHLDRELFIHGKAMVPYLQLSKKSNNEVQTSGDPKTKFLLLFLSAVRRPPIRPTK